MRANHIPVSERLQSRISKLVLAEGQAWVPKRFYPYCRHCGITNVQLSIDGDHHKGCPIKGMKKQIAHYRKLLSECNGAQ